MDSRTQLASRSQELRLELKQWEQLFAQTNGGRKATREEIKRDRDIAAKYKEYNKVRELLAGNSPSIPPSPAKHDTESSRPHPDAQKQHQEPKSDHIVNATTPRKRHASRIHTPQHKRSQTHALPTTGGTPGRHLEYAGTAKYSEEEDDENRILAPSFIGPTPQKDGRVLGLFDLLSPVAQRLQTPSKPRTRSALGELQNAENMVNSPRLRTPKTDRYCAALLDGAPAAQRSGKGNENTLLTAGTPNRHSRTPQSSGKRYLLDSFVTPSKRRRLDADHYAPAPGAQQAITSNTARISKEIATPAFLRRRSDMAPMPAVAEDDEPAADGHDGLGPAGVMQSPSRGSTWLKRRSGPGSFGRSRSGIGGVTRSLSSMIADMRKAEDDLLDEEMEMLRELEDDGNGDGQARNTIGSAVASSHVLVEDSQQVDAGDLKLLGPDGSGSVSDDDDDGPVQLGRDGKPLRVWKKKGMKRQTRRVNMRPATRPKPPVSQALPEPHDADEDETHTLTVETVAETQLLSDPIEPHSEDEVSHNSDDNHSDTGSEFAQYDDLSDDELVSTATKAASKGTQKTSKHPAAAQSNIANSTSTATGEASTKAGVKEGVIKKAVRKISASAHANFRRLKIKSSKGAKAGGGGGGRFGGRKFGRR